MDVINSSRKIRVLELVLVTGVAFAGPMFSSFYYFFNGSSETPNGYSYFYGLITETAALSVLFYVLFRQARSPKDLGLSFSLWDIPRSLILAVTGYIAYYGCIVVIYLGHQAITGHEPATPDFGARAFGNEGLWAALLLVLFNPFFEELIVRAYLMTEMKFLTGSTAIAISSSVILQTLYHVYQGLPMAFSEGALFLVFSIYFARTGRILPVILAHLGFDFIAFAYYGLAGTIE
jgi:membrane protease YdiL (CAAX protease family)